MAWLDTFADETPPTLRAESWLIPVEQRDEWRFVCPPDGAEVSVLTLEGGEVWVGRIVSSTDSSVTLRLLGTGETRTFQTTRCAPLAAHNFVDRKQIIQRQRAGEPAASFPDHAREWSAKRALSREREAVRLREMAERAKLRREREALARQANSERMRRR